VTENCEIYIGATSAYAWALPQVRQHQWYWGICYLGLWCF